MGHNINNMLIFNPNDPIVFCFTVTEMLEIYELISMDQIDKDLLHEKLRNGRMEGGPK